VWEGRSTAAHSGAHREKLSRAAPPQSEVTILYYYLPHFAPPDPGAGPR
jgi:hypothetical protein